MPKSVHDVLDPYNYLTNFGRETAAMALKLREMVVIPQLAFASIAQP